MNYKKMWDNLATKMKLNEDARYYGADIIDMMGNAEMEEQLHQECSKTWETLK